MPYRTIENTAKWQFNILVSYIKQIKKVKGETMENNNFLKLDERIEKHRLMAYCYRDAYNAKAVKDDFLFDLQY